MSRWRMTRTARSTSPPWSTRARAFSGLVGLDLAREVTTRQSYRWDQTRWAWESGFGRQDAPRHKVVAIDYGAKRNILRSLAHAGCDVTVLPASATAEDVRAHDPDGVFLSNGPGDPAATGEYAVPTIKALVEDGTPVFGYAWATRCSPWRSARPR